MTDLLALIAFACIAGAAACTALAFAAILAADAAEEDAPRPHRGPWRRLTCALCGDYFAAEIGPAGAPDACPDCIEQWVAITSTPDDPAALTEE